MSVSEGKTRLRYVGPHVEAEVVDPADGTVHVVRQGKDKAFPNELADALLEQKGVWAQPSSGTEAVRGGDPSEAIREAHVAATVGEFEARDRAATPDASDPARELAEEHTIDLNTIEGSGKDGQITKPDVQAVLDAEDEES